MYWSHTWCRNIGERKRLLCISKYHRRKVSFCNKSIESPITKDNLHSVCACQLTNRFNIVTSCGQYYGITLPNRFNIVTSCGQYYGITLPLPPPPHLHIPDLCQHSYSYCANVTSHKLTLSNLARGHIIKLRLLVKYMDVKRTRFSTSREF